jgi:cleavage and polyadenylation specificity factor subunit 2
MEDVEGIRDEQEVDIIEEENNESVDAEDAEGMESRSPKLKNEPKKFVATVQEVHEAFDAVNTLRYSQPTHLQGKSHTSINHERNIEILNLQESVKA